MVIPFEVGKSYDFTTLVGAQIGSIYKSMRVESIMSLNEALRYRDVVSLHRSLYPSLPQGTPFEANELTYIGFRNQNSDSDASIVVLALEWINKDSIEEVDGVSITIFIPRANTADISIASEALRSVGIRSFTVETSNT